MACDCDASSLRLSFVRSTKPSSSTSACDSSEAKGGVASAPVEVPGEIYQKSLSQFDTLKDFLTGFRGQNQLFLDFWTDFSREVIHQQKSTFVLILIIFNVSHIDLHQRNVC
ncbi:hypothetical protein BRADI_2g28546v3 [Brachypodium distachyon]|uniref:Uncharacterized protein n=1 Tax=Brachypodium distachyon TaxID=15368 RepID=A0A0Q3J241_BRADI|nr:hypothetical protein BRADI_2g28546v3 [Brachypodium distachyon]